MGASSLQKLNELCFYISGNVTVHPDASVASDVFLQADPGSHLIIGARTTIGPKTIIHANQGILEIGQDIAVGAQVLIVGSGYIRDGARIGALSTLMFDIQLERQEIVPPNSIIGDESRKVELDGLESSTVTDEVNQTDVECPEHLDVSSHLGTASSEHQDSPNLVPKTVVYGKASVERLIQVMFPSRNVGNNGTRQS